MKISIHQRWLNMPSVFIDGDGCPVVYETIDIAQGYDLDITIVCDTSHVYNIEGVNIIIVDKGRDRADFVLLQNIKKNDIVITQDYGLAALTLSKQAYPISQNGLVYTNENIEALLFQRHMSSNLRKHKKYSSHIKKRTKEDDDQFIEALDCLIEQVLEM